MYVGIRVGHENRKGTVEGGGFEGLGKSSTGCLANMQGSGFSPQHRINCAWWHTPAVPAFGWRRQEDLKFKVNFNFTGSLKPKWDTSEGGSEKEGNRSEETEQICYASAKGNTVCVCGGGGGALEQG